MWLAADARVLAMWVGILICISLLNLIFLPGVLAQPQQDWDKLVAAAEKEGEVTIYGQARAGVAKSIHAFADAYPKIKINFVGGQGSDLSKKVFAERRAGKNLVDVAVGGGPPMILYHKAGILKSLPEILVSPEVRDQHRIGESERDQVLVGFAQPQVEGQVRDERSARLGQRRQLALPLLR